MKYFNATMEVNFYRLWHFLGWSSEKMKKFLSSLDFPAFSFKG